MLLVVRRSVKFVPYARLTIQKSSMGAEDVIWPKSTRGAAEVREPGVARR